MCVTLVLGSAVLLAAVWFAQDRDVPLSDLTYDATSVLMAPVFVGSVARLNMMVWGAVAGASMVAALAAPSWRVPMGVLAALTSVMALDDALRLHEGVGPRVGVPEEAFYVLYALVAIVLVVVFARRRESAGLAFLLGGLMLALSVASDVLFQDEFEAVAADAYVLVEDGSKMLGALLWLVVPAALAFTHQRDIAAPACHAAVEREGERHE